MAVEEEPHPALPPVSAAPVAAPAAYRAIQVLEALAAERGPLTTSELALRIPLAKSSVSNLLTTLETTGMVRRAPAGWIVGFKALEIGQPVLASTDVVSEFQRQVAVLPTLSVETALMSDLQTVRTRRYAIDDEENTIGVTCFGIALPDAAQPIAVSSTPVTQRLTPQLRTSIVADLTTLATRLSAFVQS